MIHRFKPSHLPHMPVELSKAEILAIKSVASGTANSGQQINAINTIIVKLAATFDMAFRNGADGDRLTAFAEGKRFVGAQLLEIINRPSAGEPDAGTGEERPGRLNPKPAKAGKPAKPT